MQAMILAAGRGERLRPLTDHIPKPLVAVGGEPLIVRHLYRLRRAGVTTCVINVAHLGPLIESELGDGTRFGLRILYSREPPGALETGGGIRRALQLLGRGPFIALNADIVTDFDFRWLPDLGDSLAHLVLVPNPPGHAGGDFALSAGWVDNAPVPRATFSGIARYHPSLFDLAPDRARFPLAPLLRQAAAERRVRGSWYRGLWVDIGTPSRLRAARALFPAPDA
jgi:MurNAc alpha-1-phosphate uridylyltransferase